MIHISGEGQKPSSQFEFCWTLKSASAEFCVCFLQHCPETVVGNFLSYFFEAADRRLLVGAFVTLPRRKGRCTTGAPAFALPLTV